MQLSKLVNISLTPNQNVNLVDLSLDSRQIKPGYGFIAIKGSKDDGKAFIQDAIARGAAAILIEGDEAAGVKMEQNVPIVPVKDLPQRIAHIAATFYGHPAKELRIIGVTGTSGKTSCTQYLAQVLDNLGMRCAIIGTLGNGFYNNLTEVGLTTPDAVTLQKLLRHFVEQGAKAVAMEVSSHSINQGRINGIEFEIGIFTNLSQDHLDYHGNMENYSAVKRKFLADLPTKQVIINADDIYGRQWINELSPHKTVYAYSINKPQPTFEKMGISGISHEKQLSRYIYADMPQLSLHDIHTFIHTPWGMGELTLPLIGLFNLANALAVLSTLCVFGVSFKDAMQQISSLNPVPGRMQTMGSRGQPLVVVDYAHKPDALEKVLQTLRQHTKGKLFCVFGCGGDRDQIKRPVMAKIAEHFADQVIVTNDNPRHESPETIAREIMQGFAHPERVIVELDRSKAIQKSIQLAHAGDCVLIAGKGAEHYQQIGDEKIPFDDAEQVQHYLTRNAVKVSGEA